MALTCLPMFGEVKVSSFLDILKKSFDEADKKELEMLNMAIPRSKSSKKSTYASLARYLDFRMEIGNDIEFEAMLAYWLSWYVLPSSSEGDLNPYVFL